MTSYFDDDDDKKPFMPMFDMYQEQEQFARLSPEDQQIESWAQEVRELDRRYRRWKHDKKQMVKRCDMLCQKVLQVRYQFLKKNQLPPIHHKMCTQCNKRTVHAGNHCGQCVEWHADHHFVSPDEYADVEGCAILGPASKCVACRLDPECADELL